MADESNDAPGDVTPKKQNLVPKWEPGQSGNPAGRPKGSRSKYGEDFIADFHDLWKRRGIEAIERVVDERPQDFLRAAVAILPREVNVKVTELDDLSYDQLVQRALRLQRRLGIAGLLPDDGGDRAPPEPDEAGEISTLSEAGPVPFGRA